VDPVVGNFGTERETVGHTVCGGECQDVVVVLEVDGAVADAGSAARHEGIQRRETGENRSVESPVEGSSEIFGLALRTIALIRRKEEAVLDAEAEPSLRQHRGIIRGRGRNKAER